MDLYLVPSFNPFQILVKTIVDQLRLRGYDLNGATNERIIRIASTYPRCRELLNEMGCEWHMTEEEINRLSETVRYNVAFLQSGTYACGNSIFVLARPCSHNRLVYCSQCWHNRNKRNAK